MYTLAAVCTGGGNAFVKNTRGMVQGCVILCLYACTHSSPIDAQAVNPTCSASCGCPARSSASARCITLSSSTDSRRCQASNTSLASRGVCDGAPAAAAGAGQLLLSKQSWRPRSHISCEALQRAKHSSDARPRRRVLNVNNLHGLMMAEFLDACSGLMLLWENTFK